MGRNENKYFLWVVSFMVFACFGTADAQGIDGAGAEPTYDKMFNKVEATAEHDVLTLAGMEEDLSIFIRLVQESGLENTIALSGPVTILAPTNEAFSKMPREQFEELTYPPNRDALERFIHTHVLPRKVYMREFEEDQELETSLGEHVMVETTSDGSPAAVPVTVVIGGAGIIKPDVEGTNGLIHVMDDIVWPERYRNNTLKND